MHMSSQDFKHANDWNCDETYLDLDASSRQSQPVYQTMKDKFPVTILVKSGAIQGTLPRRPHEIANIWMFLKKVILQIMTKCIFTSIPSRQPESSYQGITNPVAMMNSEMCTELDPKLDPNRETEYQDITGNSHDSDQDCEYQVFSKWQIW